MSALTFKISAQLEAAGFKQAADYMKTLANETQKAKSSTAEHGSSVDLLKTAYAGLVGLGVVEFFKSAYEEAAQAREQEILLSNRVEQTGLSYEKAKPKLDAFFEGLQAQTGIARDRLIPAFNELIDKTQSVRASQELMSTAMGLARAKGMDLAAAAEMVGGAYNSETRALQQLGRTMGMTRTESEDNEKVMAKAASTYQKYAGNVDGTALALSRLQNAYKDFKESVGSGVGGKLKDDLDMIRVIGSAIGAVGQVIAVGLGQVADTVGIEMDRIKNTFTMGWREAGRIAEAELKKLSAAADVQLAQIGETMDKMMNPQNQVGANNLVDTTKRNFAEMNDAMEILLAEGVLASEKTDYEKLQSTTELIDAQNEAVRNQLHDQAEWSRLSAEDQQALDTAIVQKGIADKIKAWQTYAAKTTALGIQVGTSLGQSMGAALNGQEDAWAGMMRTVIDVIVQGAQAYLAAWTASKVAVQLESEDYAGAAKTAAIGGIYAGIISAGGEVAKSQIKGGGTKSSSSSSGGGGGTISAQGAPAATSAASSSSISVYVYGDVVDSDAFMNSLAARLSDKVQNSDVKLVASSVTP